MNRWALHLYVCIRPYKRHMNWMLFAFASGADVFIAVIEFHLPFYYNFFLFLLPRSSNNSRMRMVSWIHDEPAIWILPHGQVRHKHYDQTLKHRLNNNKNSENRRKTRIAMRIHSEFKFDLAKYSTITEQKCWQCCAESHSRATTPIYPSMKSDYIIDLEWQCFPHHYNWRHFGVSVCCCCVFGSFVWNDQFIPNTDVH